MELLAYKGASQSQSPGTGSCTWLPLGVLATQLCGRAPKETVTHGQQMACVVFHPSTMPLPAPGYATLCAERCIRAGELGQTDTGVKGEAARCIMQHLYI